MQYIKDKSLQKTLVPKLVDTFNWITISIQESNSFSLTFQIIGKILFKSTVEDNSNIYLIFTFVHLIYTFLDGSVFYVF